MATPNGLFYAYAKNVLNDVNYRYIITFQDQSTADQWWRAVIDSVASGNPRFKDVTRLSNQLYTHNPGQNIIETINDDKVAKKFLGRVFFSLMYNRDTGIIPVAPVLNYTTPSSGSQFFIRSVLQPELFWYFDARVGRVRASTARRTRFTVGIHGSVYPTGTIMIPTDQIYIKIASNNKQIGLGGDDTLVAGTATIFDFSDFSGGFGIRYDDANEMSVQKMSYITEGESWALAV